MDLIGHICVKQRKPEVCEVLMSVLFTWAQSCQGPYMERWKTFLQAEAQREMAKPSLGD